MNIFLKRIINIFLALMLLFLVGIFMLAKGIDVNTTIKILTLILIPMSISAYFIQEFIEKLPVSQKGSSIVNAINEEGIEVKDFVYGKLIVHKRVTAFLKDHMAADVLSLGIGGEGKEYGLEEKGIPGGITDANTLTLLEMGA